MHLHKRRSDRYILQAPMNTANIHHTDKADANTNFDIQTGFLLLQLGHVYFCGKVIQLLLKFESAL